jgi:hypothetical protein
VVRVSWTPLLGSFTQLAHAHLLLSRKFKQFAIDPIHDSARHTIPSQFFKKTSPAAQQLYCRNIPSSSEHPVMPTTFLRAPSIQSCRQHPDARRASSITANISMRAAYSTFEDSVASVKQVTISRRFVARYCHLAFGWLDRNRREGAIYSGGRLGIAAAVVRVSCAPLLGSFTQLAHSHLLLS